MNIADLFERHRKLQEIVNETCATLRRGLVQPDPDDLFDADEHGHPFLRVRVVGKYKGVMDYAQGRLIRKGRQNTALIGLKRINRDFESPLRESEAELLLADQFRQAADELRTWNSQTRMFLKSFDVKLSMRFDTQTNGNSIYQTSRLRTTASFYAFTYEEE